MPFKDPERRKEYNRAYHQARKEEANSRRRARHEEHRDEENANHRVRHQEDKEENNARSRLWYEENKEKACSDSREYYAKHREEKIKYQVNYERERLSSDPIFRQIHSFRSRTRHRLKGVKKAAGTFDLLGCNSVELWDYLESKFHPDPRTGELMTRQNYGAKGWVMDHIRPISDFKNLANPEQQRQCFHYTNLQPLWWHENLEKSDKY